MTISLGGGAGLLAFAFPAIFWEDTELGFSRMEATGVEVRSTSQQGPMCQMRDPHSEPGAGAHLSPEAPNAGHSLPR